MSYSKMQAQITFNSIEKAFDYKPKINDSLNSDFTQEAHSQNSENQINYQIV